MAISGEDPQLIGGALQPSSLSSSSSFSARWLHDSAAPNHGNKRSADCCTGRAATRITVAHRCQRSDGVLSCRRGWMESRRERSWPGWCKGQGNEGTRRRCNDEPIGDCAEEACPDATTLPHPSLLNANRHHHCCWSNNHQTRFAFQCRLQAGVNNSKRQPWGIASCNDPSRSGGQSGAIRSNRLPDSNPVGNRSLYNAGVNETLLMMMFCVTRTKTKPSNFLLNPRRRLPKEQ